MASCPDNLVRLEAIYAICTILTTAAKEKTFKAIYFSRDILESVFTGAKDLQRKKEILY